MHIHGPAHLHGAQPIGAPHSSKLTPAAKPPQPSAIADELQISDVARLVAEAQQLPDIRHERVQAIRAEIAAGTYETPEKLEIAISRLLDELV